MATTEEIKMALKVLGDNGISSSDITILHCNTEYPTPFEDVNLNTIAGFKKIFSDYNIGFSDHSPGYFAGIASVPYGITFIEKHFTLNKDFEGPDHKASVTPDELKLLCEGISPMYWYDLLGQTAETDFEEDQLIVHSGFKEQEV